MSLSKVTKGPEGKKKGGGLSQEGKNERLSGKKKDTVEIMLTGYEWEENNITRGRGSRGEGRLAGQQGRKRKREGRNRRRKRK